MISSLIEWQHRSTCHHPSRHNRGEATGTWIPRQIEDIPSISLISLTMTPADQANNEPSPCHDLLTFLDQPARVLLTPTFGFWKRSIASSVRRFRQEELLAR